MIYLSRLLLNHRSREVQRDLADCHRLHGRILSAFPQEPGLDGARERFGILYRLETGARGLQVLVQSRYEPDWSKLPPGYLHVGSECKRVDEQYGRLREGMVLMFRLRANPTRRVSAHSGSEDPRWHGKRVELRCEEEQLAWLGRKGDHGGFELLEVRLHVPDVRTASDANVVGTRFNHSAGEKRRLVFGSVLFEGKLRVRDAEQFRRTLETGIGSGKAYGFGLLSIMSPQG